MTRYIFAVILCCVGAGLGVAMMVSPQTAIRIMYPRNSPFGRRLAGEAMKNRLLIQFRVSGLIIALILLYMLRVIYLKIAS